MKTGMQLFMRHAEIHRTVTVLPNGVRAVMPAMMRGMMQQGGQT
jgi:hypothetical protein